MPESGSPEQHKEDPNPPEPPKPSETASDQALKGAREFLDVAESSDLWDDAE